ncbi:MAG: AraC family transcriptional regulator [Bacteroidota bacterium]
MTATAHIRQVGNNLAHSPLNFRNVVLHSRVTAFDRREADSGLSLKLALTGTENYTIGHLTHRIRPGYFLLVNEHQQFHCQVRAREAVEGICIYLDPELVQEIYHSGQLGHDGLLENPRPGSNLSFLEKIYSLGENALGKYLQKTIPFLRTQRMQKLNGLSTFLTELAEHLVLSQREIDQLLGNLEMERPATRQEVYRRVSIARNYIEAHFLEDIALDDLAELSCLSKYHFLRCFKQVYGRSPYQYVLARRIEKGQELLTTTDHNLTEIAYQTGFTDRRAFNKAFRKTTGTSPREYREMN